MIRKLSLVAIGTLLIASAHAAPIRGSISFSDGFDLAGLPTLPSTSIVSGLTSLDVQNAVNVYTPGSGQIDFATVASALAFDILPPALPTTFFTTTNGFLFEVSSFVLSSVNALSCSDGLCTDAVAYLVAGNVSAAGFDTTPFRGRWTAQGSCLGDDGTCTDAASASWSASLVARVPEPATLALLGLGLLGFGLARRRGNAA